MRTFVRSRGPKGPTEALAVLTPAHTVAAAGVGIGGIVVLAQRTTIKRF